MKKVASKQKPVPRKRPITKQTSAKSKARLPGSGSSRKPIKIESVSFMLGNTRSLMNGRPKGVLLPGLSFDPFMDKLRNESAGSGTSHGSTRRLGSLGTRNIIGQDDRQRVPNTRVAPYPWICYLEFSSPYGIGMIGTGWLLGPRTVVTAGHCIYSREEYDGQGNQVGAGPMKQYRVRAGVNAELGEALAIATVTEMATTRQWIDRGMTAYDFGVLYLDMPIGDDHALGHFAVGRLEPGDEGTLVCVPGYPHDKQYSRNGSMWADVNRISSISDQQLGYVADTLGGNSGAPVIFADGQGNFTAVGIHNYGGDSENYATRINEQVAAQLEQWKR